MIPCYKCGNRENGSSLRSRCADCECSDNIFNEHEAQKYMVAYLELIGAVRKTMNARPATKAMLQGAIDRAGAVLRGEDLLE